MKEIKIEDKKICFWSFILVLLNFGMNYSIQYATDSYATFYESGTWKVSIFENGRPLHALVYYFFEALHISKGIIYHLSQISGIVFLTLAVTLLAILFKNYVESDVVCVLVSFIALANPFIIEYMLFVEQGLFMLVILVNVIAVALTVKVWEEKESIVKWIVLIQLFLFVAVMTYQTGVQIYVVLCLPFIMLMSADVKDFIKKNIFVAVMYAIPLGTAYGMGKFIFAVERLNESEAIENPLMNFLNIFCLVTAEDFFTLKKGTFLLWLFMLFVAFCIMAASKGKDKLKAVFGYAYIIIGCIVVSFLMYITGTSDACWPRMIYSYGLIFGVVSFYILSLQGGSEEGKVSRMVRGSGILVMATVAFILCINFISFEKAFVDRYKCNQEDLYFAEIVGQRISEYEEETGNTIDTICYYSDKNISFFGRGYEKSELSQRAQTTSWSRHYSILTYLDKDYAEREKDPELEEYFSSQDWNTFSEKQLVFRDNVLHLCAY